MNCSMVSRGKPASAVLRSCDFFSELSSWMKSTRFCSVNGLNITSFSELPASALVNDLMKLFSRFQFLLARMPAEPVPLVPLPFRFELDDPLVSASSFASGFGEGEGLPSLLLALATFLGE